MGGTNRLNRTALRTLLNTWRSKAPTRSALQIAEAIEDVGGYINAYQREMTYYVQVLEDDVALGLDVVSGILLNPVLIPMRSS